MAAKTALAPLQATLGFSLVESIKPRWDGRKLYYDGVLCRELLRGGGNVQTVLDKFQDQGWPENIENPTDADIGDIIKCLNKNHTSQSRIQFCRMNSRIGWVEKNNQG
jgi:hypothetical protein